MQIKFIRNLVSNSIIDTHVIFNRKSIHIVPSPTPGPTRVRTLSEPSQAPTNAHKPCQAPTRARQCLSRHDTFWSRRNQSMMPKIESKCVFWSRSDLFIFLYCTATKLSSHRNLPYKLFITAQRELVVPRPIRQQPLSICMIYAQSAIQGHFLPLDAKWRVEMENTRATFFEGGSIKIKGKRGVLVVEVGQYKRRKRSFIITFNNHYLAWAKS